MKTASVSHNSTIGISETTLHEMTYITMRADGFPLLAFVNEPLSHLSNGIVRKSVMLARDIIEEQFGVPTNTALAYEHSSLFVTCVNDISPNFLSPPLSGEQLVPLDGDGLVELRNQSQDPLSGAVFHRLHAIDAPELY